MPQETDGAMLIYLLWIAYIYACVWTRNNQHSSKGSDVSNEAVDATQTIVSQRLDSASAFLPSAAPQAYVAGDTSTIEDMLSEIERCDKAFRVATFRQGVSEAYEAITVAFAKGDRATLKQLVSTEVYQTLLADILERERKQERAEVIFVRIEPPEIVDACIRNNEAEISVRFFSELFNAVRGPTGTVIYGNAQRVANAADIWTFAKEIPSSEPIWRMIASRPA